jgi:hypothetical protein
MSTLSTGCILLLCLALSSQAHEDYIRVLERSMGTLTFVDGKQTHARRINPRPQMVCIGEACDKYRANTMRCVNAGSNGIKTQWTCETQDIEKSLSIGETIVQCEGFDRAGDEYILAGSCSVTYKLLGTVPPPPPPPQQHQATYTYQTGPVGPTGPASGPVGARATRHPAYDEYQDPPFWFILICILLFMAGILICSGCMPPRTVVVAGPTGSRAPERVVERVEERVYTAPAAEVPAAAPPAEVRMAAPASTSTVTHRTVYVSEPAPRVHYSPPRQRSAVDTLVDFAVADRIFGGFGSNRNYGYPPPPLQSTHHHHYNNNPQPAQAVYTPQQTHVVSTPAPVAQQSSKETKTAYGQSADSL